MVAPFALPMAANLTQPREPDGAFLWGRGGQRMTPEEIAIQRDLAARMSAQGMDFSPVGHWTQGLARAAQGALGGLAERKARKALDANAAESLEVLRALMGGDAPASNDAVLAALTNPYVSDQVRDLAGMEYQRRNPKPQQPNAWEQMLLGAGLAPGSDEWRQANADAIRAKNDPQVTVTLPGGGIFVGPQSELANVLQGGGGQASGVAPGAGPPAMLPPDFDFGDEGGSASAPSGFPGRFRGLDGETVTSTFRSPSKNRSVGGVRNSYHMRRDAKGNPMARDSVPPPGMGMAAYAEQLRRLNPWADVINEGDHVHMEPR